KLKIVIVLCSFTWIETGWAQYTPPHNVIREQSLQSHVAYLSAESLQGRLTGSLGEKLATQYVASIFQQLELTPAGDHGTYFQKFDYIAGVDFEKNNSLSITNKKGLKKKFILNQDWRPLSFSNNKTVLCHDLIFAGYGIIAPALGNLTAY